MIKDTKKAELEEKLIEELESESDYSDNKGNRKLLIIGGVVAVVLVVIAIVLSLISSSKKAGTGSSTATLSETETSQKPDIAYNQEFSRDAGSSTANKAGEPENAYPSKTSGARVPVDESGKPIEGVPIQKSLMIDDRTNPFYTLNTIAPDIYDLMEINLYNVQNKQLSLGELVDRARMEVPADLLNRMDNFYRIFMYRAPDEKGPGTAMVFSTSLSKAETEKSMQEWEKTIINSLKPFILIGLKKDFVAAGGEKSFQSSTLSQGGRFVDFSENGIVSLNYTVVDKYIIFANSRSTFEKVYALMQKK